MPDRHHASSSNVDSRRAGRAEVFADWWRQVDRWVNEGGAERRTITGPHQVSPESRHDR